MMEKDDPDTNIIHIHLLGQLVFNAQDGLVLKAGKLSNTGKANTCGSA